MCIRDRNNALLDYREFKWLQQEYARLTDLNNNQTEQMQTFLDQLAEPSVRERIFSIADAVSYTHLDVYKRQTKLWQNHNFP